MVTQMSYDVTHTRYGSFFDFLIDVRSLQSYKTALINVAGEWFEVEFAVVIKRSQDFDQAF